MLSKLDYKKTLVVVVCISPFVLPSARSPLEQVGRVEAQHFVLQTDDGGSIITLGNDRSRVAVASEMRPAEAQLSARCTDVRAIDFRNFVYPLNEPRFTEGKVLWLKVVAGRYEQPHSPPTQGFLYFEIGDLAFGDLTGDGVEDAAVVATYGSNSGNFHVTDTYIFSCVRGTPTLMGTLTQDHIQKDSGVEIWTSVDHPMTIKGGALEVTYETRGPQASPVTFLYKLVGRSWQRQGPILREAR